MKKLLPPVLTLLCILLMLMLDWQLPLGQALPPPWHLAGLVPILAGIALAAAGRARFARVGTEIYTFREPGQLVTGGVFRLTRNPMYLGMALLLAGVALLLGSLSPLVVAAGFVVIADRWYIRFEEAAMTAKFGDAYRAYQQGTRRWL